MEDLQDSYKFLYPFGWQEVAVSGADVVYKDVVEPLESVSVTLTATDKNDITEFGDLQTVSGRQCDGGGPAWSASRNSTSTVSSNCSSSAGSDYHCTVG